MAKWRSGFTHSAAWFLTTYVADTYDVYVMYVCARAWRACYEKDDAALIDMTCVVAGYCQNHGQSGQGSLQPSATA